MVLKDQNRNRGPETPRLFGGQKQLREKYFYRAVDKQGNTIDFLLTAKRDKKAALRFLTKAIERNDKPGLINIDKSGANTAAIKDYNNDHRTQTHQDPPVQVP